MKRRLLLNGTMGCAAGLLVPAGVLAGSSGENTDIAPGQAIKALTKAFENDPHYAHSWHCNISCAVQDAMEPVDPDGDSHEYKIKAGNEAASRFMKMAFGVETSA